MVELDLISAAIVNAVKAAGLRAESAKFADAAEFHRAAAGAFLRDVAEQQAAGGNSPAAPVRRRAADRDASDGDRA